MNTKRDEGLEFRIQGSGFRVQGSEFSLNHLPSTIYHEPPSSFILQTSSFHRAFTLVELLVTITIIGMLAGLSLGMIHYVRNVAAESKTKATIAKLNAIVMQQYESYMTRRIPLGADEIINSVDGINPDDAKITQGVAQLKLDLIRDLIRMEMPDRWLNVTDVPYLFQRIRVKKDGSTYQTNYCLPAPTLKLAYLERYNQAKSALVNKGIDIVAAEKIIQDNGGPECLYLFVSIAHPEAMEQFSQNEIGDIDGDGCPEFIDGWGTPISFLRWAPGYNQSDIQANINTAWNDVTALQQRRDATTNDHDPFDPLKIDLQQFEYDADLFKPTSTSDKVPTGWRLVPLIYSFGPDKKEGLYAGKDSETSYKGNPYESMKTSATSTTLVSIGTPKDTNEHLDNITNHRIEQQ